MKASVSNQGNLLEIVNFTHYAEDAKNGNPYNCTFDLHIISGTFSGWAPFEYDIKEFRRFISELNKIYQFKRNSVSLNDICYGSEINFSLDKYRHIVIEGIIYGEAIEHSLKFSGFIIDQTFLPPFIDKLRQLIE